jgi:hypothetical protein
MPAGRRRPVALYVVKDERWSTVARFETVEDAYRYVVSRSLRSTDGAPEATHGWSLWTETEAGQQQIQAPGALAELASAWDVVEGDRADRAAGAEQIRRERGARSPASEGSSSTRRSRPPA